jgi:hypothetical protein
MTDILAQVGTKVGTEFKSLGSRVSTLESGGGVDSYSETTHTNGIVSEINTWSTSSKSNLVQTKSFTYTNGLLTKIVVKDGSSVTELTKTFTYDGDGNLASITKDYA